MPTVPGAASTAVRDLLTGPATAGRVLGVHQRCAYVLAGDVLVALETADALGLPCAVRLGADGAAAPLSEVRAGDGARVGGGLLQAGPLTVRVARYWAPVRTRAPRPTCLLARAAALADRLAAYPCPAPVDADVDQLLGLGPGLTPAGDDVLAGMLVALHHHPRLHEPVATEVARLAPHRTTALSAALLRHAAMGLALPAVTALADTVGGHGPESEVEPALERLLGVGSSSGAALAHGLLRGARTVAGQAIRQEAVA